MGGGGGTSQRASASETRNGSVDQAGAHGCCAQGFWSQFGQTSPQGRTCSGSSPEDKRKMASAMTGSRASSCSSLIFSLSSTAESSSGSLRRPEWHTAQSSPPPHPRRRSRPGAAQPARRPAGEPSRSETRAGGAGYRRSQRGRASSPTNASRRVRLWVRALLAQAPTRCLAGCTDGCRSTRRGKAHRSEQMSGRICQATRGRPVRRPLPKSPPTG
eukprot:scaffold139309_cov30-Tisochrysis_lutea.AAC.3